jgi:hypothetical protein
MFIVYLFVEMFLTCIWNQVQDYVSGNFGSHFVVGVPFGRAKERNKWCVCVCVCAYQTLRVRHRCYATVFIWGINRCKIVWCHVCQNNIASSLWVGKLSTFICFSLVWHLITSFSVTILLKHLKKKWKVRFFKLEAKCLSLSQFRFYKSSIQFFSNK